MKVAIRTGTTVAAVLLILLHPGTCSGQALDGPPANPEMKYSTETPPGVDVPDTIETRLGTLRFFDGFPDRATADTLYDNLDFQRAVQAFLFAIFYFVL